MQQEKPFDTYVDFLDIPEDSSIVNLKIRRTEQNNNYCWTQGKLTDRVRCNIYY